MKWMMTTALLTGLLTPCAAMAQETDRHGGYLALEAGMVGESDYDYSGAGAKVEADADSGVQYGAAYGMYLTNTWRFEIGLRHQEQDLTSTINGAPLSSDGSAKATMIELNGYYDFPLDGPFRPYVGVGIGVGNLDIDDGLLDDDGEAVSLQALVGAAYNISDRFAIFVEGRGQMLTADVEINGDEDDLTMTGASALAGVRIKLGS